MYQPLQLILGPRSTPPLREPIVHYGPFLMNTRQQILDAVDDFNSGRMGTIPAVEYSN